MIFHKWNNRSLPIPQNVWFLYHHNGNKRERSKSHKHDSRWAICSKTPCEIYIINSNIWLSNIWYQISSHTHTHTHTHTQSTTNKQTNEHTHIQKKNKQKERKKERKKQTKNPETDKTKVKIDGEADSVLLCTNNHISINF